MTKTIHGKVHGKTIELDEDPGLSDGQEVDVQIRVVTLTPAPMSEGLKKVYALLGQRFHSGHTDTAERHNEHQP